VGAPLCDPAGGGNVVDDIREGFRFVRRREFLRYMTAWIAVANMVGNSFLLMMVALLQHQGAGPQSIGVANSAVVAGGMLASVLAGLIIKKLGSRRVFVLAGGSTLSVWASRQ